ncbi:MAG: L-cystine transport system permease protein YecS [Chroococcidiopsis cubana SAG 39.79]|jgi:polar amino acid transport system permease protein|uniref:Amino acid ABC transporter membrane protein 2, PAAT family n=2 Tax=Chroococcidiopsis TaxID=54298 RepID=K9TWA3_CHRTP|nr:MULTISPECIES: amino acid ABC transporter permease [Chroococcidiopsis]PSB47174.1 amino acid ABC transporter permease [Cyanosarcina cf. burmensis CCALA 770]AFY86461.1 amino acid ABC transporter membrane protein 2, PAAT family [Chroococcidiopsis thermalis PCC 7203]MDZ4873717.1 L-cystine transport system permease protein YecS [Chroococcidiopsis cubana SAG 39.79]PSB63990.1 amino acid ABC transporter permease [Chroococcidiopsis cubana CCALA 043]RUT13603.1 ABC transporter permease [Chroococcidiops
MDEFTIPIILKNLIIATQWTLILSAIAFISGGIIGFLVMLMRISPNQWIRGISWIYIEFFEGTPLLLQLFLAFFGLSVVFGVNLSPLQAATLALTAFTSSFLADIWRGSVAAIPQGQWEAASALGFGYFKKLRLIVLPQALKLSIAPTVGFAVQVIKGTSLASVIGFTELSRAAAQINNVTLRSLLVFSLAGLIYFCLCYPLSILSQNLERKLTYKA